DSTRDHGPGPVMPDVARREPLAGADLPGEESVPERFAGDDAHAGAVRGRQDLVDPFLSEQAEGNLEGLRLPRLEAQRRFHRLVDRDAVVGSLSLRFQRLEGCIGRWIRYHPPRRLDQLSPV